MAEQAVAVLAGQLAQRAKPARLELPEALELERLAHRLRAALPRCPELPVASRARERLAVRVALNWAAPRSSAVLA